MWTQRRLAMMSFCRQFPEAFLPNHQYHDANPFEVPDITASMIAEVMAQMKPSSQELMDGK